MSKFILLSLTLVNIVYICISIKAHVDNHSILPTHHFYTETLTTSTLFIKCGGQDTFITVDICPATTVHNERSFNSYDGKSRFTNIQILNSTRDPFFWIHAITNWK